VALPADARPSVRRVLELSGLSVTELDDPREVRFPVEMNGGPAVVVTAVPKLAFLDDLLWSLNAAPPESTSIVVFVGDATDTDLLPERAGVTLLRGPPSGEALLPLMGGLLVGARSVHRVGGKPVEGGFESSLVGADSPLTAGRILIVDDERSTRQVLHRTLEAIGFKDIVPVTSGEEALAAVVEHPPDLIILDLEMPGMDGFAVLEALRPLLQGDGFLPVLVVTGDQDREHRQRVLSSGAKDFLRKPFDVSELGVRVLNLLETRRLHLQLRDANGLLEWRVRRRNQELSLAKDEIIFRLARAAEYRDDVTGRHAVRVAAVSAVLAGAMGLDAAHCEMIRLSAPLHDVGKIGIPDAILLKPGRLTADESDVMRRHTTIGADLLANSTNAIIEEARVIALTHHERWDGSGYPAGLKGDAIAIQGRVVAVADALDALTHERPYKPAYPFDESMRRVIADSGSAFDARVVAALQAAAFRVRDILSEPDESGAEAGYRARRTGNVALHLFPSASRDDTWERGARGARGRA
jgi:putative two-component system response regulator